MRRGRTRLAAATGLMAAIAGGLGPVLLAPAAPAAASTTSGPDQRLAEMASPSPFRGLVYTGLSLGQKGSACDGVFEAKTAKGASLGCTHGPDPAPPGTDVRRGRSDQRVASDAVDTSTGDADTAIGAAGSAAASLGSLGCIGDGVSGPRVQAIYAIPADRPDRSATVIPAIRATYAPRIDWQFNQSAAETGGEAHVTFVTEPTASGTGCQLSVAVAHLSAAGDDSFSNTTSELKALGYSRTDRKYLIWMDSDVLCGVGSLYSDAKPGLTNLNNGYAPMFARVDSGCWNYAEGHELMHTLGAVQSGAPHATTNGHCWDEPDEMCYDDGSGIAMVTVCTGRNDALFDCKHDDYFYAGVPPTVNWLATHWNTFNSSWLLPSDLPALATIPIPGTAPPGTTTTTSPTTGSGQGTTGPGSWVFTSRGRAVPFGDARFFGDTSGIRLNKPIIGSVATPTGLGYYLFASDGGIFSFGDAAFQGSTGNLRLNKPVVAMAAAPSNAGYWLVGSDGGLFAFGDARFYGSMGNVRLNRPVSAVVPGSGGYL